jgi:hypothetical protein
MVPQRQGQPYEVFYLVPLDCETCDRLPQHTSHTIAHGPHRSAHALLLPAAHRHSTHQTRSKMQAAIMQRVSVRTPFVASSVAPVRRVALAVRCAVGPTAIKQLQALIG